MMLRYVNEDNNLLNLNDSMDLNQVLDDYITDPTGDEENKKLLNDLIASNYYDLEKLSILLKDSKTSNREKLNVIHINIQSLSSKFDKLKNLMNFFQEKNVNIDVLLLCETHLHEGNKDLFNIQGYNFINFIKIE